MQFVVRITKDDAEFDFKAFEHRKDAYSRYLAGTQHVQDVDGWSSAWFEYRGDGGPREAIAAVKAGDKERVQLIDIYPIPFTLDLSEVDLKL